MRRNCYPEYKFLEGLLQWYFGSRVTLSYRYQSGGKKEDYPLVLVNDEIIFRGKIRADETVKYLEKIGVERLDKE